MSAPSFIAKAPLCDNTKGLLTCHDLFLRDWRTCRLNFSQIPYKPAGLYKSRMIDF